MLVEQTFGSIDSPPKIFETTGTTRGSEVDPDRAAAALAVAALASRGSSADGAGGILECGRAGGVGVRQLVGGPAGNGRWRFLSETAGDLALGQLEFAGHHNLNQPAAMAAPVSYTHLRAHET